MYKILAKSTSIFLGKLEKYRDVEIPNTIVEVEKIFDLADFDLYAASIIMMIHAINIAVAANNTSSPCAKAGKGIINNKNVLIMGICNLWRMQPDFYF